RDWARDSPRTAQGEVRATGACSTPTASAAGPGVSTSRPPIRGRRAPAGTWRHTGWPPVEPRGRVHTPAGAPAPRHTNRGPPWPTTPAVTPASPWAASHGCTRDVPTRVTRRAHAHHRRTWLRGPL